ncbi:hypothetical protein MKW92_030325 [Papaver armeniacum]|nr:hypothetical protein MKW92_030325 [Papaver armeniacum]
MESGESIVIFGYGKDGAAMSPEVELFKVGLAFFCSSFTSTEIAFIWVLI